MANKKPKQEMGEKPENLRKNLKCHNADTGCTWPSDPNIKHREGHGEHECRGNQTE